MKKRTGRFGFTFNLRSFIKNRRLSQKIMTKEMSAKMGYKGRTGYSFIETQSKCLPRFDKFIILLELLNLELLIQDKKGRICELPLSVYRIKISSQDTVGTLPHIVKKVNETHEIFIAHKENPNKFCKLEIIDRGVEYYRTTPNAEDYHELT